MSKSEMDQSPKRHASPVWWDVPAGLAILLGIFFLLSMLVWNPEKLRVNYERVALSALDAKDYPTALVAGQRLLGFGSSGRNEAIFILAKAKLGMGRTGDAAGLLEMIAPFDKPVFAPAHLLVAQNLIGQADVDARTSQAIVAQLRNVLALEPDSIDAKELLAQVSIKRGNWLEARKHLESIVTVRPVAMFQLIDIARALGDQAVATEWAGKALLYYRTKFESLPSPSPDDRILYGEALLQAGDFESALRILAAAPESDGDAASESRVAVVYRAWANAVAPSDPEAFRRQVRDLALEMASGPKPGLASVVIDAACTDWPADADLQKVREQIHAARQPNPPGPLKNVEP